MAFLTIASACNKGNLSGPQSASVHTLTIGDIGELSTLDPMPSTDLNVGWLSQLTLAYLVRFDHANRPIPELVTAVPTRENSGIDHSGTTITYHLRRGVRWSDGAPFDAEDVAFTTRLILKPSSGVAARTGWDRIVRVDVPDRFTVRFRLRAPFSPAIATFFSTAGVHPAIMPKHLFKGDERAFLESFGALPLGTGPFSYVRWKRGDRVELIANDRYWRGPPKLRRITFLPVPNRNTLFNELETREVDLWAAAAIAFLPRVRQIPSLQILRNPSYAYSEFMFNVRRPVLADPRVRQALLRAYDRVTPHAKLAFGVGLLQDSVLSPASPFSDGRSTFTPRNLARASALLDAAGWRRGPDGIRVRNGQRLELELVLNTGSHDLDARIEMLRQNWRDAGVRLETRLVDTAILYGPYADGGILETGKFDVAYVGTYPDGSGDLSRYGCRFPPTGQNLTNWCDRTAENAIDDFERTYDRTRQRRDDAIVVQRMREGVPDIVTMINEDLFISNRRLKNFHPNQVSFFDDMMAVDTTP